MTTINIIYNADNDTAAPLFRQYVSQLQPQRAFLKFYPGKEGKIELVADYFGEVGNGGCYVDTFNGTAIEFTVSPCVLRSEIEALAENKELAALLERIRAGYSEHWDGNWRGRYTEDAQEASEAVDRILEQLELASIWDADEWVQNSIYINEIVAKGIEAFGDECEQATDADQVVIGNCRDAVARALSWEVIKFIRSNTEGNDTYLKAAQMLAKYDAAEYASTLEEYLEEFGEE